MSAITAYINGAITELRHVRWPTRQQAVRFSAVVIVFTGICAVFFGFVDFALSQLISFLLSFAI